MPGVSCRKLVTRYPNRSMLSAEYSAKRSMAPKGNYHTCPGRLRHLSWAGSEWSIPRTFRHRVGFSRTSRGISHLDLTRKPLWELEKQHSTRRYKHRINHECGGRHHHPWSSLLNHQGSSHRMRRPHDILVLPQTDHWRWGRRTL